MNELITTLERRCDLDSLISSRADTILVSLMGLSSGAAENLNIEEIPDILASAKEAGKKIAIRANMILHEGQLEQAEEIVRKLAELPYCELFFSDPAIYVFAKTHGLTDRLIYDPETLMTSVQDARWWLERKIRGIAISPLLTLQETTEITEACGEAAETAADCGKTAEIAASSGQAVVTIHGRTMMSRSHRKLLTAYKQTYALEAELTGKRDLVLVESKRSGRMPVYEDESGTLIYSDDLLESFDFMDQILAAKPLGLVIEGAFMPLDEQLAALAAYRRILDGESASLVGKEYREQFACEPLDSGYYEQKTVR